MPLNIPGMTTADGGFDMVGIFIGLVTGLIGWCAWRYGRQNTSERHMILGVILMGYPYLISGNILSISIGVLLTALLFWP